MSESREQVAARELAAKFDFGCTGCDDHDYENCGKCAGMREDLEKVVARALAACALANLEQGWALAQVRRQYEYDTMRAMLERAAGEKVDDYR